MTPVQTSPRVCVRTSHSPVSRSRSLPLSLSLSALTHTHTQRCWSEIGSWPENSLGLLGGISPPFLCVAWLFRAPPCFPESSPSAFRGAAAAAPPRPGDLKCEEGQPLSPAPSRRVSARDASRAGSDGGLRGFAGQTELASRRRRLPAPPAAAAPRGLPSLRTSVGLFSCATPFALIPEFFIFPREREVGGCVRVCQRPLSRSGVWETAGKC